MDNKSKEKKDQIIKRGCEIISRNLGSITAGYYRNFYQDKSVETIFTSLNELLSETVGPKNAKKQLEKLTKK